MSERNIAEAIMRHLPKTARWAYYQKGGGPIFFYNTERLATMYGGVADGRFESGVLKPVGKGARSGKATRWVKVEQESAFHELRRDAKARAYQLYREWLEKEQAREEARSGKDE